MKIPITSAFHLLDQDTSKKLPLRWYDMCSVRLPDQRVFVAGGRVAYDDGSLVYDKAWMGSSDLGTWTELPDLPGNFYYCPRCGYAVLNSGTLQLFVGFHNSYLN